MKANNLWRHGLLLAMLMLMVLPLGAQDLSLPATTKSKEAKTLYLEAIDAFYDVEFIRLEALNEKALKADPNFFMGHYMQLFYSDKAKRKEVRTYLANYDGKLNKGEKVIKSWATKANSDKDYKGTADLRELVRLYPKNIFPKALLAYNLGGEEATQEEALTLLQECAKLNPDVASVHNSMGYLYLGQKKYDLAEKSFDQYIKMASDKANPYDSKGDYYMAVKEYDKAAAQFKKAYDMNSDFAMSKKKHDKAMWMVKRDAIAKEVEQLMAKQIEFINGQDMKYLDLYDKSPEFSFSYMSNENMGYSDMAKGVEDWLTKSSNVNLEIVKQITEVPAENVVTISQLYRYSGVDKDGKASDVKGNFFTVWRKDKDDWRIIQAVNINPLKE